MSGASGDSEARSSSLPPPRDDSSTPALDSLATPPSSPPLRSLPLSSRTLPSSSNGSHASVAPALNGGGAETDEEEEAQRWLLEAAAGGSPPSTELNGLHLASASPFGNDVSPAPSQDPSVQPRLPPEILRYLIITHFRPSSVLTDALVHETLHALSQVSRLVRCWALEARYSTLLLPRNVREFRKWFEGVRKGGAPNVGRRPFEFVGWTRAVFSGMNDVSRLTSASQGWESQLLQLLHYAGPRLEYLSLWHEESKVLLRDASQVKGRHGHLAGGKTSMFIRNEPVWSWGEGLEFEDAEADSSEEEAEPKGRKPETGEGKEEDAKKDEAWEAERESRILKAEAAAARERARQTMPTWLRRELEVQPASEIRRRFRAHLPTEPIEDDAYWEALAKDQASRGQADSSVEQQQEQEQQRLRKTPRRGCAPRYLSIHINLPLYEHQRPSVFRRMAIWRRIEELDVFVNTGAQVPMVLFLLSHLDRRKRWWRLRVSGNHATLAIQIRRGEDGEEEEDGGESEDSEGEGKSSSDPPLRLNMARCLRAMLVSPALRSALMDEFKGNHVSRPDLLVGKLEQAALDDAHSRASGVNGSMSSKGRTLSASTPVEQDVTLPSRARQRRKPIRVVLRQGNQLHLGRLKDRREDFLERVEGNGQGYWARLGFDRDEEWEEDGLGSALRP